MSIFKYEEKAGYFRRLKEALQVTKDDLSDQISQVVGTSESRISDEQLEDLESILIGADLGVEATLEMIERIREETRSQRFVTSHQVRRILRRELLSALTESEAPPATVSTRPHVVLVVGVNGVGKTTTIGKLVHHHSLQGEKVLVCASDTFRAAAVEQLDIWAKRTGADIVKQASGADPAAVLFDAISASRARKMDLLIVDTAGRLHTKSNLMQELDKMKRIAGREVEGAPHEVYLILDATTGQNGLVQARQFLSSVGVTGIIVAKLDGTAKGGIVVAIARELKIPIRFVGTGEKLDALVPFSAEAYVNSLLAEEPAEG